MTARIIDGKAVAQGLRAAITEEVSYLSSQGLKPGLAVVLVGEDPASQVYVRSKARQTTEVGMASFEYRLSADIAEAEILALISRLNADHEVDGILVQLPLPKQIDAEKILQAIDPAKDVDGFHPINVGLTATDGGGIVPCTPLGSLALLKSVRQNLAGLNAVIIGRSNIVGKPMAQLLLRESCTVTIAHSRTSDLPATVRQADIVVAAVGQPEMIRGVWLKPNATVIDVGINRILDDMGKNRLVGDVAFHEALTVAGAITPVPGGVGPMTIACLLKNTLEAAKRRRRAKALRNPAQISLV
jgi:methylenetetrahydrofolate dehydrogenase (NADP+) / methenyltetrahydrofolate cyclohydrolase